jgi:hypothetical protein
MNRRPSTRSPLLALLPLTLALSLQACGNYTYIDLDLKVGTGFSTVNNARIKTCHMYVTGASNEDFNIVAANSTDGTCPPVNATTSSFGKIDYSTLADSGNVTFTLKLFEGLGQQAGCLLGQGATTVAVDPGKTVIGTVTVPYMGPGCPTVPGP